MINCCRPVTLVQQSPTSVRTKILADSIKAYCGWGTRSVSADTFECDLDHIQVRVHLVHAQAEVGCGGSYPRKLGKSFQFIFPFWRFPGHSYRAAPGNNGDPLLVQAVLCSAAACRG